MSAPLVEIARNDEPVIWVRVDKGQVVTVAVDQKVVLSVFDDGTTKFSPGG